MVEAAIAPRHRTRTPTLLIAAGITGALLAGCGSSVADSSVPADTQPTPLHLGRSLSSSEVTGPSSPGLATDLPAGPDSAPLYRFAGGVDETAVAGLADALGIAGAPERHAHGWVVGGTGSRAELVVRDDGVGAWAYSNDVSECGLALDADATAAGDTSVSCAAPASPGGALGPGSARAAALAEPVLTAVGLAGASPRVTVSTGATYVAVDPVIDGLPTTGITTSVTVTEHGVTAAQGTLARLQRGPDYPIVSAKAAYASLASLPRPEIAIACPDHEDGAPLTGACARRVVTGATVGLTLRSDDGTPVLVPAWLFSTKDAAPIAIVAVTDRFLAEGSG